jgi:hypothetical protein
MFSCVCCCLCRRHHVLTVVLSCDACFTHQAPADFAELQAVLAEGMLNLPPLLRDVDPRVIDRELAEVIAVEDCVMEFRAPHGYLSIEGHRQVPGPQGYLAQQKLNETSLVKRCKQVFTQKLFEGKSKLRKRCSAHQLTTATTSTTTNSTTIATNSTTIATSTTSTTGTTTTTTQPVHLYRV